MKELATQPWHALEPSRVLQLLESDHARGLSSDEAERRHARYGPNVITRRKEQSALVRFLLQFHQPLIYILLAASIITLGLKEWVDAAVIFGVVLLNAIIGFVQESKAVQAIEALARGMTSEATVVRNGVRLRLPAEVLVPGDLVVLSSGDRVPADLRLLSMRDFQVDESALTGESLPVEKQEQLVAPETLMVDRRNMAYASTNTTYGQARGVVTAIGDATEVGRISQLISTAEQLQTPLTRKIRKFSQVLMVAILALAAMTFGVGLARGEPALDMFMATVALIVGAIPEGLPAAITIMLAIGVSKMARRRAIIRSLPAVETLGSTTVICSDKTGTLTENEMTVTEVVAGGARYVIGGVGYAPQGSIERDGELVRAREEAVLRECLTAGMLCNDSQLVHPEGRWRVEGDPTEGALLVSARKAGLELPELTEVHPRVDSIPFESAYQYMATLHQRDTQDAVAYVKGAVEAVLSRCEHMLQPDGSLAPLRADEILREAARMAAQGLRVLCFAKAVLPGRTTLSHDDVRGGLTFLGLQGMLDPPRAEARTAIAQCRRAGIDVKMITGDHGLTARAIAEHLGMEGTRDASGRLVVRTGQELASLNDAELKHVAGTTTVFARVTPEQKLRLVRALQAGRRVVAMTGDGVNDAPALKQADIGVAMGITGTDVAKQAADMVLTDDNFASIEAAVEEGRAVFDNLTKFIVWTLPTNLGEGLIILVSIVLGTTLPIHPVQVLWINMTTAVLLGLTLAFEAKEPDVMERPPRPLDEPILTRDLIMRTLFAGTLILAAGFGLFELALARGGSIAEARTVAANVVVIMETCYLFNCRSLVKPLWDIGFFSNRWVFLGAGTMIVLQLVFTYAPFMNSLFGSAPVSAWEWLYTFLAGLGMFVLVGVEKLLRGWTTRRQQPVMAARLEPRTA